MRMAIDHPIFIIKKYVATLAKINARNQAYFAPSGCSPVFTYPIIDEVEYVPIAFVCNERSNAACALDEINLDPEGTELFSVSNLSSSNKTSSTTHSITVMFAPSYMVDNSTDNPIFTKRSFFIETGDDLAAGETHSYTANDLGYSIPEGYVPFSLTKFHSPNTNCLIFTTINPLATGDEIFVAMNNMYTAARSTTDTEIEVVFVREDMQDLALRQALYITAQSGVSVTCNRGSLVLPNEIVNLSVDNPDHSNYDYHIAIDGIAEETTYIDNVKYSFSMPDNNVSINVYKTAYTPFCYSGENISTGKLGALTAHTVREIPAYDMEPPYYVPSGYNPIVQGFRIGSSGVVSPYQFVFSAYTPEKLTAATYCNIYNPTSSTASSYASMPIKFNNVFIDSNKIDDQRM